MLNNFECVFLLLELYLLPDPYVDCPLTSHFIPVLSFKDHPLTALTSMFTL